MTTPTLWWGVDSRPGLLPSLARIQEQYGADPHFLGRALASFRPTTREVASLHADGLSLLLIWDGASPSTVARQQYESGYTHGTEAVLAASALGCPSGRFLPVDIESCWAPKAEWLAGYIDAVTHADYVGGAYLDPTRPEHTDCWLRSHFLTPHPAYIYAAGPPILNFFLIPPFWHDFATTPLGPESAPDVIIHQYSLPTLDTLVDLDLATQQGYDLLWHPPSLARC